MRAFVIAAVLAFAAPAVAQTPASSLTLADTATAPAGRVIVDGAAWTCEGTSCVATGGANQPAARACKRVVARVGKVSAFTWKGQALTADQLATCNA